MTQKDAKSKVRVVELFAGVGGFRVGLERASKRYETVWFNQWEPGRSDESQHAWAVYCKAFGLDPLAHRVIATNSDIAMVGTERIPDHDLLVGGFPCQDYSVARTLSQAEGLKGKKGVLWWEIYRIIREKGKKAPRYLMLENVDRLLKSPATRRGRDFAIMLSSLAEEGYAVEWRVINAADYGMPQRRRRVYMIAYRKSTPQYATLASDAAEWLKKSGVTAKAFPAAFEGEPASFTLDTPTNISDNFDMGMTSPFQSAGVMVGGDVLSARALSKHQGAKITLADIILAEEEVPESFFIPAKQEKEWARLKDGKTEMRKSKTGFAYKYAEGPIAFPDPLDKPSRTIVTGEGGSSPSRFKHVIRTESGRLRRLTPLELEKLNMFPAGHTEGATDTARAFFMGNALVTGIVEKLGKELAKRIDG